MLLGAAGIAGCPSLASTLQQGCTNSVNYTVGDTVRTTLGGPNSCTETDGTLEDFYNVTVPTPQIALRIKLSSGPMKSFVRVFDFNRTIVANSAYLTTPDTAATLRVVLAPGGYQIVVGGTVVGQGGPYTMYAVADSSPVTSCATAVWITRGISTSQALTTGDCTSGSGGSVKYFHPFLVVLLSGAAVTVTESSTAFNPAATLASTQVGSQYSTLDTTGTLATILGFATVSDAYSVQASSVSALQTGAYKLRIK